MRSSASLLWRVSALRAAARPPTGRDGDHHRNVSRRVCRVHERRSACGTRGRQREGPHRAARPREDVSAHGQDELRHVHDHARPGAVSHDRRIARFPRAGRVLRQHDLSSDRPRIRDPGGDPTQSGSGGPGYQTRDVPPGDASYVKGVVAMAKTQAEPRGTSGSQFFVVTGADIGLPPDYAIVGTVTDGLAVVDASACSAIRPRRSRPSPS